MDRTKKVPPTVATDTATIVAYKGFDKDLACNPNGKSFRFEVGKTYSVEGEVEACRNGFHACPNPLDVFRYYPPSSRFCVVELAGDMDHHEGDKIAARSITVTREITLEEMILETVRLRIAAATIEEGATASGDQGAATASGTRGAATASGYQGAATASGIDGRAQGKDGCALFLVERIDNWGNPDHGKILNVWSGIVGFPDLDTGQHIKPDTFYRLVDGKPVEVE